MLNTATIFAAMALAEQFDGKRQILVPIQGTPLHHLCAATNMTADMAIKLDDGQVTIDFTRLKNATALPEANYDKSRHDYAMADFADIGIKAVNSALMIARTKVSPQLGDMLDLLNMRLSNAPVNELNKFEIREEEDCPVLYGPALRKLTDQYNAYPGGTPVMTINAPDYEIADLVKMLATDVGSIDDGLLTWAATLDTYTLTGAWQKFFTFRAGNIYEGVSFDGRMEKSPSNMLLVFCWARHMLENDVVPEGMTMPLASFRAKLEEYVGYAGRLLSYEQDRNDAAIKNRVLVRSVGFNRVNVYSPVYRAWLESGGDTDVLYGMAVSGNDLNFTVDTIEANAEKYKSAWKTHSRIVTATDSATRFNYLREQLVLVFESIINRPDEDGNQPDINQVKNFVEKFQLEMRDVNVGETQDLHCVCLKLLCRTLYSNTASEFLLSRMDEEAKRNPDIPPREAATVATLEYINYWIASQMMVKSIN
jgi:hypothetical protein